MSDDKPPSPKPQQKGWIDRINQLLTGEPQDRDDLFEILQEAKKNRLLDNEALLMIQAVLQFSEARVRDVMIPRAQMTVVAKDAELKEIFPVVIETAHSRFPVIAEDRSEVVGILLAKDLLPYFLKNQTLKIEEIMRPTVIVPESKRLNVLLKEFRTNKNHMAIVVDEYGTTAGLVTIEDVLEQIVGEIEDEHDPEEEEFVIQQKENEYSVKALMPIDEFNEYFSVNMEDKEFDTIGGWVVHQLEHMPKKGEKLEYGRFRFEVLRADNRRVYLLKLKIKSKEKQAE
jgi:magnesium and cobalt transporter